MRMKGECIVRMLTTYLFTGGLVEARRRGGLARLAQQVGQHRARARAAALVGAARPPLHPISHFTIFWNTLIVGKYFC